MVRAGAGVGAGTGAVCIAGAGAGFGTGLFLLVDRAGAGTGAVPVAGWGAGCAGVIGPRSGSIGAGVILGLFCKAWVLAAVLVSVSTVVWF